MGVFQKMAIANEPANNKGQVISGLKTTYKQNERLIKGLAQAAALIAAMKVAASYLQR